MILPDMQSVLCLDAFVGDARAHHFREAVNVDGIHVEGIFDFGTHGVRPRLGAENADLERRLLGVETDTMIFVEDRQHVGRRDHDDLGAEVLDELHLPLGHAARYRHDRAAEALAAVMRAEPAGEEPVAISVVHDHAGATAGGNDRARHQIGPGIDVVLRVADDRRLAGRAR